MNPAGVQTTRTYFTKKAKAGLPDTTEKKASPGIDQRDFPPSQPLSADGSGLGVWEAPRAACPFFLPLTARTC